MVGWRQGQYRRRRAGEPIDWALAAAVQLARIKAVGRHNSMDIIRGPFRSVSLLENDLIVTGLEPGEPVFVIRARDTLGLPMVALYAGMADQGELFDAERRAGLRATIQEMIGWRRANMALVRDPD